MASFIRGFCILLLSANSVASQCSGASYSRSTNSKLTCHVFKTLAVNSIECQQHCADTLNCFSLNAYRSGNGTEICELIRGSKKSSDDDCFVIEAGSEHNDLTDITSCSSAGMCKTDENRTREALTRGWFLFGEHRYKLFKKTQTNDKANETCAGHGAALAEVNTQLDLRFISEVFAKSVPDVTDSLTPKYYWKLDGTDKDITLAGDTRYKPAFWVTPTVLEFPNTAGSYATTPFIDVLHTSFSLSVWIIPHGIVNFLPVYGYWTNPYIFQLLVEKKSDGSNAIVVDIRRKSNVLSSMVHINGGNVALNKWTHIALTWERSTGKTFLYQDGQEVATAQASSPEDLPPAGNPRFDIGFKRDGVQVFHGRISRLAVFDRVLTVQQVKIIRDMRMVWLGSTHGYTNFVSSLQSSGSSCVTLRAWQTFDKMDRVDCTAKMQFICRK